MRFLRAKVIQELMQTERDYVNLLQHIVQGFTKQCLRRSNLFSAAHVAHVQRIFGNIKSIYALHCKFLRELELAFNRNVPESPFGAIFLRNRSKFFTYSEYCNCRPISSAELALLSMRTSSKNAKAIFRGICVNTSAEDMSSQLSELLKATPSSHLDREPVEVAVSAMENVAAMINEKKRRFGLQQIALWQMNVDGWRNSWKLITIGKEMIFTCKNHSSKIIWVEYLQRSLIYSSATSEERRLIREKNGDLIYRTSSCYCTK